MRVLWFTLPFSDYGKPSEGYNGGGWVSSLEKELKKNSDIELGISFFLKEAKNRTIDGVSYFPMNRPFNKWIKLKYILSMRGVKCMDKDLWVNYEREILRVVNSFKPDVIQIFGSEECFGLIANKTKIPVIIHIQGIINPYINAFLPPLFSWNTFLESPLKLFKYYNKCTIKGMWEAQAEREKEIYRRCVYYIGRTEWDKRITMLMNKNAKYFFGSEILRPAFYLSGKRILPEKLTVVSTISSPLYKGFDLILKTAGLLKQYSQVDFEWKVYGNIDPIIVEKQIQIRHTDVNVSLKGVATAKQLREALLECTIYVHSSYIDNSPNSVCEAQILGCTVVTTNSGGIPSLIENGISGFNVPTNDPYQMASFILEIYNDPERNIKIGKAAESIAKQRHDKSIIVENLINIYNNVIENE